MSFALTFPFIETVFLELALCAIITSHRVLTWLPFTESPQYLRNCELNCCTSKVFPNSCVWSVVPDVDLNISKPKLITRIAINTEPAIIKAFDCVFHNLLLSIFV